MADKPKPHILQITFTNGQNQSLTFKQHYAARNCFMHLIDASEVDAITMLKGDLIGDDDE